MLVKRQASQVGGYIVEQREVVHIPLVGSTPPTAAKSHLSFGLFLWLCSPPERRLGPGSGETTLAVSSAVDSPVLEMPCIHTLDAVSTSLVDVLKARSH